MIFRSRLTFLFCFILTFRANTKKLPQSESKNRGFCSDLLVFLIVQRQNNRESEGCIISTDTFGMS